jgi:hypothetical protein
MTRRIKFILFLLLPALTSSLRAVQMDPLTIEAMAEQSALILRGTVLSRTCLRDPVGRIYTKVELDVAEVWKGTLATNRFTVVHGGGILGEEKAVVSGQAEYEPGEEVVVFLVLNQRGEGVTRGLAQGKFHVWEDAGEQFASNPFHGRKENRGPAAKHNPASDKPPLRLSELKRRAQGGGQ